MTNYIKFRKLNDDAKIPTKGTNQSAGFDLYALEETKIVGGNGNYLVKTGVGCQLPYGTYGRIAMRSGLAVKQHLSVSAGVIDIDYEDKPLGVVVYCTKNNHEYTIKKGEKFAQLVVEKMSYNKAIEVKSINKRFETHQGWGSTGKK